ncbi:MAG: hypothetical protein ABIL58_04020 [Pseudomonadota bacterium]
MRVIELKEIIEAPACQVFDWFMNLDKNYIDWHPSAHQYFRWLTEKPIGEGSLFEFSEEFDGHPHRMFMKITAFKKNQKLSFASERIAVDSTFLPAWLIERAAAVFQVKIEMHRTFRSTSSDSTELSTRHIYGSQLPIFGRIIDWILDRFFISDRSHLLHMKEESSNMIRELEKAAGADIHRAQEAT